MLATWRRGLATEWPHKIPSGFWPAEQLDGACWKRHWMAALHACASSQGALRNAGAGARHLPAHEGRARPTLCSEKTPLLCLQAPGCCTRNPRCCLVTRQHATWEVIAHPSCARQRLLCISALEGFWLGQQVESGACSLALAAQAWRAGWLARKRLGPARTSPIQGEATRLCVELQQQCQMHPEWHRVLRVVQAHGLWSDNHVPHQAGSRRPPRACGWLAMEPCGYSLHVSTCNEVWC